MTTSESLLLYVFCIIFNDPVLSAFQAPEDFNFVLKCCLMHGWSFNCAEQKYVIDLFSGVQEDLDTEHITLCAEYW